MYVTQFNWRLPFLKGWDKIGLLFLRGVPISTTYLVKFQSPLQDFHLFPVIFFYHNHLASGLLASHHLPLFCRAWIQTQSYSVPVVLISSVVLQFSSDSKHPKLLSDSTAHSPQQDSLPLRHQQQLASPPPYFWPTWLQIQTVPKCPSGFIIQ